MRKFKVRVERSYTQFWEVEARSEKEAFDNYANGNLYQTNAHGDALSVVKELANGEILTLSTPKVKVSDLLRVLPKETIDECGWHLNDVIVLTVSETFVNRGESFKGITLDEERNLAYMDSNYDYVSMSKKELAGYMVSHSTELLQMIENEDKNKWEQNINNGVI